MTKRMTESKIRVIASVQFLLDFAGHSKDSGLSSWDMESH